MSNPLDPPLHRCAHYCAACKTDAAERLEILDGGSQRRIEEHLGDAMLAGGGIYTVDYIAGLRVAAWLAGGRRT